MTSSIWTRTLCAFGAATALGVASLAVGVDSARADTTVPSPMTVTTSLTDTQYQTCTAYSAYLSLSESLTNTYTPKPPCAPQQAGEISLAQYLLGAVYGF